MKKILNKVDVLIKWLEGKKTYITGVIGMACGVAFIMGYLTQEQLVGLGSILGFSAINFLRMSK